MSVCTFIAADIPLQEAAPSKMYPVHIDLDKGTIEDGGADDNFFLFSFLMYKIIPIKSTAYIWNDIIRMDGPNRY